MVHNHTVWENIHKELLLRCQSIQDLGDWIKVRERLDYLRRKYRDCLKNNKRTGSEPIKCPYFEELDAVLGCRPMNNPRKIRMDNGGVQKMRHLSVLNEKIIEESDSKLLLSDLAQFCLCSAGGSGSTEPLSNTSRENDVEDDATSEDSGFKAPPPPTVEPKPQDEL
ncbi:hypothetical protein ABVT39_017827 [Epinephelus coioides]